MYRFKYNFKKRRGRLITATRNNTNNTSINRTKITRKIKREEKQLYEHFKRQTSEISNEKTWTWLTKGDLKRETESLLISVQKNEIRTTYIVRIYKTQQNSRCRLCADRDETMNHIISECSKLAQKDYKTWHGSVRKMVHRVLCKKLKFGYANKWYMHYP